MTTNSENDGLVHTECCAVCHGPWHPSTGYIVGSPRRYPMCGNCSKEAWKCFRWAINRVAFSKVLVNGKKVAGPEFYPEVPLIGE